MESKVEVNRSGGNDTGSFMKVIPKFYEKKDMANQQARFVGDHCS